MSLSLYSCVVLIILVSFMHVVISFVFHPFLKDDYFASKTECGQEIWGLGWARLDQIKVDLM